MRQLRFLVRYLQKCLHTWISSGEAAASFPFQVARLKAALHPLEQRYDPQMNPELKGYHFDS